jgi:tRNA G26 N,N-dimethylase Trm1
MEGSEVKEISEGMARIKTYGNVFYNPVQQFNRDLRLEMAHLGRRFHVVL